MERKLVSGTMLTLLLTSMLTLTFNNIQPVKASGTIYIRSDGSVDPPTAPIQRDGDLYTFTGNIYDSIVVERDNIVVDGAGHTLQGPGYGYGSGITLSGRSNVIIRNLEIKSFWYGIWLEYSSYNSMSGNNITNNRRGIGVYYSSYNSMSGNNITNNGYGIGLERSSDNSISGNNITNNGHGIELQPSSNNKFWHNNFIDNTQQVYDYSWEDTGVEPSINVWDDGYPSGGNYWSDYTGIDEKSGPNQDLSGSDGIGDTPYIIDANNRDSYPLMKPWPIIPATVDFDPDTLDLKSKGQWVTICIELPVGHGYDISQIDVSSIRLNGTVPALAKPTEIGDYDGDGIPDLMVKFDWASVIALFAGKTVPGNYVVEVTGTVAGMRFKGTAIIRVISPP